MHPWWVFTHPKEKNPGGRRRQRRELQTQDCSPNTSVNRVSDQGPFNRHETRLGFFFKSCNIKKHTETQNSSNGNDETLEESLVTWETQKRAYVYVQGDQAPDRAGVLAKPCSPPWLMLKAEAPLMNSRWWSVSCQRMH